MNGSESYNPNTLANIEAMTRITGALAPLLFPTRQRLTFGPGRSSSRGASMAQALPYTMSGLGDAMKALREGAAFQRKPTTAEVMQTNQALTTPPDFGKVDTKPPGTEGMPKIEAGSAENLTALMQQHKSPVEPERFKRAAQETGRRWQMSNVPKSVMSAPIEMLPEDTRNRLAPPRPKTLGSTKVGSTDVITLNTPDGSIEKFDVIPPQKPSATPGHKVVKIGERDFIEITDASGNITLKDLAGKDVKTREVVVQDVAGNWVQKIVPDEPTDLGPAPPSKVGERAGKELTQDQLITQAAIGFVNKRERGEATNELEKQSYEKVFASDPIMDLAADLWGQDMASGRAAFLPPDKLPKFGQVYIDQAEKAISGRIPGMSPAALLDKGEQSIVDLVNKTPPAIPPKAAPQAPAPAAAQAGPPAGPPKVPPTSPRKQAIPEGTRVTKDGVTYVQRNGTWIPEK